MEYKDIDTSKFHGIHLGLLRELKRVCDKNNIPYYIACGTCIGAVRHKGFIPWDHDVDVIMHISDVYRLVKVKEQFREPYFFQSKETDPEYSGFVYRLCNSDTTYITKEAVNQDKNHGFWLDIYPIYYAPEQSWKLHRNVLLTWLERLLWARIVPANHGVIVSLASRCILTMIPRHLGNVVAHHIQKIIEKEQNTEYFAAYYGLDVTLTKVILYPKECFVTPGVYTFEGENFSGPSNADLYLTVRYGNYMKPPPIETRYTDFSDIVFVDANKSFKEYRGVYYCR